MGILDDNASWIHEQLAQGRSQVDVARELRVSDGYISAWLSGSNNRPTSADHAHMLIRNVPVKTRLRFKSACLEQGHKMRTVVVKFMETFADAYEAKEQS